MVSTETLVSDMALDESLSSSIQSYISTKLSLRCNESHYSPYGVAMMLLRHVNVASDGGTISKSKIIKHLIQYNMVPIKKSSLYILVKRCANGLVHVDSTWTEVAQSGKKGYLTCRDLKELILDLKQRTSGGIAFSSSEIRNEVSDKIRNVFQTKKQSHLLPHTIPLHTLNVYVSIIKAQDVFNIYGAVGNKTESRAVAEWSLRSTIAYTMVVAVNHFIPNVTRTVFHPKKKDLCSQSVEMWDFVETAYNKMLGNENKKEELMPVLPNMVTTTDEVTIFATSTLINHKEKLYIVAKPEELKNEMVSSGSRNHYKQKTCGDAHCRGVRIVINSTFTAGGLSAPIFVSVFGLTNEEMSGPEDIVTVEVPGLTVGSHQDVYSTGIGYLSFVRGSGSTGNNDANNIDGEVQYSKESKVAKIYREKVFYPFIEHIRRTKYGFDGNIEDVPDFLKCVSWMDGCNSQLRLITSEKHMREEKKRKIVCCKHSAARTAVEQAADTGAMFKYLKKILKSTENPTSANNSIVHHLEEMFASFSEEINGSTSIHLASHKKKAIILTLAKLPIAASRAYSDHIIKKAFVLNGQLDTDHLVVPSLENCCNTYRGNIHGTCLENRVDLIQTLYEGVFTKGMVEESVFDAMNIQNDTNYSGAIVSRDFSISNENRQRSKCLTSEVQIQERKAIVLESKMVEFEKKLRLYENEDKEYERNKLCEMKLMALYDEHSHQQQNHGNHNTSTTISNLSTHNEEHLVSFPCVSDRLTYNMMKEYKGKINMLKCDIKSFVRVRSDRTVRNGKITYLHIPDLKDDLLKKLIELRNTDIKEKVHNAPPVMPE